MLKPLKKLRKISNSSKNDLSVCNFFQSIRLTRNRLTPKNHRVFITTFFTKVVFCVFKYTVIRVLKHPRSSLFDIPKSTLDKSLTNNVNQHL